LKVELSLESEDVLAALSAFAAAGVIVPAMTAGHGVWVQDVFFAAVAVLLAASSVGLASCACRSGLGCVAASLGHPASVVGLGSGF